MFCVPLRPASFSVKVSSNQVNGGKSKKFPSLSKFPTLVVRSNFSGFKIRLYRLTRFNFQIITLTHASIIGAYREYCRPGAFPCENDIEIVSN